MMEPDAGDSLPSGWRGARIFDCAERGKSESIGMATIFRPENGEFVLVYASEY